MEFSDVEAHFRHFSIHIDDQNLENGHSMSHYNRYRLALHDRLVAVAAVAVDAAYSV